MRGVWSSDANLGDALAGRKNSFNFLRIAFALVVLFSHAETVGGFGKLGLINQKSALDTIMVYGFFSLSGFLIAASATRNTVGRYLWARCLRVLPGFWISLILTAFVFSFIGWFGQQHHYGNPGTVMGYLSLRNGPLEYCGNNLFLQIIQPLIGKFFWNGSLWTLYYEFICYLTIAILCILGLYRFRISVLIAFLLAWSADLLLTSIPELNGNFTVFHNWVWMNCIIFLPIFLLGSVFYLYRNLLPDSVLLAIGSLVVFVVSIWIPFGAHGGPFRLSSVSAMAPFLVYPIIWLGIHLPFRKIGSVNDYSYGIYIYAYPVERLLSVWGVNNWGYLPYALVALLCTIPFAVGSWFFIESRMLQLKSMDLNRFFPGEKSLDLPSNSGGVVAGS